MHPRIIPVFVCLLLSFWSAAARAQSNDPSELFLNGYQGAQKGERLEGSNNVSGALQAYQEAAQQLEQIKTRFPTWNQSIVEFRLKRITEAVARLQKKVGTGGGLDAGTPPGVSVTPAAPRNDGGLEPPLPEGNFPLPPPDEPAPPKSGKKSGRGTPAGVDDPLHALEQERIKLRQDFEKSQQELDDAKKESEKLRGQLEEEKKNSRTAANKSKGLEGRADALEKALSDERARNTQDQEKLQVLQAERDKVRKELREMAIDSEAQAEVERQKSRMVNRAMVRANEAAATSKSAEARAAAADTRVAEAQKKAESAIKSMQEKTDAAVADAQKQIGKAVKERDDVNQKLVAVTKERDEALQQVTKMKESQKQVDKVLADNTRLMAKLADADKQIAQFKEDGAQKDLLIANLKKEVSSVRMQLSEAQKQSATFQTQMTELKTKLDATSGELEKQKANGAAATSERKKMVDENELLRGIVLRQMKEGARRAVTSKAVLGEMASLDIKSRDLLNKIRQMGEPTVLLTSAERKLFKQPHVELGDGNEISAVSQGPGALSTPAADTLPADPAPMPAPSSTQDIVPAPAPEVKPAPEPATVPVPEATPAPATPAPSAQVAPPPVVPKAAKGGKPTPVPPKTVSDKPKTPAAAEENSGKSLSLELPAGEALATPPELPRSSEAPHTVETLANGAPARNEQATPPAASGIPAESLPLVQRAKDEFERGNYRDAEKTYEQILQKVPANVYVLSNLGVARYRLGKLKLAEESFRKALAIAPEDGFSHSTLGIVYYVENKYDEAVNELTKALAINPKNAVAHNYLGITASQKGWQDAAQKELETAVSLDPNYGDAWFNLAVVFATKQPVDKENARRCYKKAISLGAEADPSLEQLIK